MSKPDYAARQAQWELKKLKKEKHQRGPITPSKKPMTIGESTELLDAFTDCLPNQMCIFFHFIELSMLVRIKNNHTTPEELQLDERIKNIERKLNSELYLEFLKQYHPEEIQRLYDELDAKKEGGGSLNTNPSENEDVKNTSFCHQEEGI